MSKKIPQSLSKPSKVAVVGATGYGGLQTIRLLNEHPDFTISYLAGNRSVGKKWNHLCPFIPIEENHTIGKAEADQISSNADYAIFSLPNGFSSRIIHKLLEQDVRVIDLSADYRYRSLDQWKQIYVKESEENDRGDYDLCKEAVYGLPEFNYEKISKARLVAAPGCFPTASLLPLAPFLDQGLIDTDGIIIDAKTGTSGGGRSPKENLLLAESSESIAPYGVVGHRHTSEIEQQASESAGKTINVQFTPHLIPMVRGLLATVYARLRDPGLTAEDCRTVLAAIYRDNPCIEVLPVGIYPATKWAKLTNRALLSIQVDNRTGRIVLMCAIDNLLKGQAGQAIQCLNIMQGLPQEKGLPLIPFYP